MSPDHYQALGVTPLAGPREVRAAYLRLMREHHPDHHPGDEASAEVARRANAAWTVLADGARRAGYDRARAGGAPDRVLVTPPPRTPAPAYSPAGLDYRASFSRACWRVGVAVLLVGLVVLNLVA